MSRLVLASLIVTASYLVFWLPVFSRRFFELVWQDRLRRIGVAYFLYWIVPLMLVGAGLLQLKDLGLQFTNVGVSLLLRIVGGIGGTALALWGFSRYFEKDGRGVEETAMEPYRLQMAINSVSEEIYFVEHCRGGE